MKKLLVAGTLALALAAGWMGLSAFMFDTHSAPEAAEIAQKPMKSIYDIKVKTIEGKETTLAEFKGKKLLIVNVASKCGFTPQYADLEDFHKQYGDKVVVLGFPANDFGGQEPGSNSEIAQFCKKNYGVSFRMFEKIKVTGNDAHPLYQWLSSKDLNGWNTQAPKWNFCKYLVNEKGELVKFFASGVNPMDEEVLAAVKK